MLTIKDFKKGDTAYMLIENNGRNAAPTYHKVTVCSVGRKYVTLDEAWHRKFMDFNSEYLLEAADCGEKAELFKTEEDVKNYLAKKDLTLWLGCFSVSRAEKLSLEQLSAIRKIVEQPEKTE